MKKRKKSKHPSRALTKAFAGRFYDLGLDGNSFRKLPMKQRMLLISGKGTMITVTKFMPIGVWNTVVPRTIQKLIHLP